MCSYNMFLSDSEPTRGTTPFIEAAAAGHEIIVQGFLQHVSLAFLSYSESRNILVP